MGKKTFIFEQEELVVLKNAFIRILRPAATEELESLPKDLKKAINVLAQMALRIRVTTRDEGEDRPNGLR